MSLGNESPCESQDDVIKKSNVSNYGNCPIQIGHRFNTADNSNDTISPGSFHTTNNFFGQAKDDLNELWFF